MKIKRLFLALFAVLLGTSLVACGGDEESKPNNPSVDQETEEPTVDDGRENWVAPADPMQICVGSESVVYYQRVLDQYVKDNNLPFEIEVVGVDTGSYADTFLRDPEVGADIFVAAHDNLGKLMDGAGSIAPITDDELVDQIKANTSVDFQNVCYLSAGGALPQFYGVPIIRQSLVLYYDKTYFSTDADVASWEQILAKAKSTGKLATTYLGSDGYSYSHWLLAQPANDAAINAFGKKGSLQLFQVGMAAKNKAWGDDQVAIHRYAQNFTLNANGRNGTVIGDDSWVSELQNQQVLTVIGGAWNLTSIKGVLGDNYGVTVLPTFKLTAKEAYGKAKSGMEFRSGSFYDVKCLMKKKDSAFDPFLDEILLFLSSDEVQEGSYKECGNLPASLNVKLNSNDALANAQINQGEKAGIPQPFGYNATFNPTYYSKGTAEMFIEIHQNTKSAYGTSAKVKLALQRISYIWAHNQVPNSDSEVTAWANAYTD